MKRAILSLLLLVTMSVASSAVTANIGWYLGTKVAPNSGFVQNALAGAGGTAGALAGAKLGAMLGAWGGPIGSIVLGGLGAG